MTLKIKPLAPLVIACTALMFSGCSASEVINTGGDTKCKDFVGQDDKKQSDEVSKMLKDKSGAEPSSIEITATRASAKIYCQTVGKPDSKISESPHG
jgi:acid stress chaperone HdeA